MNHVGLFFVSDLMLHKLQNHILNTVQIKKTHKESHVIINKYVYNYVTCIYRVFILHRCIVRCVLGCLLHVYAIMFSTSEITPYFSLAVICMNLSQRNIKVVMAKFNNW